MAHFIRFLGAMCMVGVSDSYSLPTATNTHHVEPRRVNHARRILQDNHQVEETGEFASSMNPLVLGMIAGVVAAFLGASAPAFAGGDAASGKDIFAANCAGCHSGGGNALAAEKTLSKAALTKYGKYEVPAIKTQIAKGQAPMPAFGEKLSADDVEDVAAYVREQADKGW